MLDFCRDRFGGGKVHKPRRGYYNIDFNDFLIWFNDMPGQGDIVSYGNIVGIIGKCTPSEYYLCAYTGQNGQLIQKDMVVYPNRLSIASCEDTMGFKKKMIEAQITYSIKLGMLTSMYIPENGEFVRVVQDVDDVKYAIFNKIESSDYLFYYIDNAENKIQSTAIPMIDCALYYISPKEGVDMMENFSRLNVMWNPRSKEFFPVPPKVERGCKYWYVNDKFGVCQAKDTQTPVHRERYKNGNYFTSYSEALVFIKRLKELRMELNQNFDL